MKFTQTPTPSITATPSMTPSVSPSYTPTGTVCPGLTPTMTPSVTLSPTITPSTSPCINCYEYSFTASTSGLLSWLDCDGIMTDTFVNNGETYNITCIGAREGSVVGTGTITQGALCSSNCLTPTPSITPSYTPTNTETPTPTATLCRECDRYANNTFETLEINYQSCEGVFYVNELIPANQTVCIVRGSGGGTDWADMDLQATDCNPPCPTPTPTPSPTEITYDLYDADRYICDFPGCTLDATGIVVALPSGTSPNYGKFYPSYIPDGFAYLLNSTTTGGPGWILSTLNYTSCTDACSLPPE